MSRKANSRFAAVIIAGTLAGVLAVPCAASAQVGYGAQHGNSNPLASLEQAGPDTLHHGKTDDAMIKSAKAKIGDADPRVRVDGLEELRYVRASSPEATELMFRGLSDPDVRVRIKAIDVLGARGVNDAVPLMAQQLFLRETPPIEKLHLVAALGRIGDSRGTLPILEYLNSAEEVSGRGTAVFALGEIGDPHADDRLIKIMQGDKSPLVRKLAQEALEKIDGEIPSHHSEELAADRENSMQTADEKLAKMREIDAKLHQLH